MQQIMKDKLNAVLDRTVEAKDSATQTTFDLKFKFSQCSYCEAYKLDYQICDKCGSHIELYKDLLYQQFLTVPIDNVEC